MLPNSETLTPLQNDDGFSRANVPPAAQAAVLEMRAAGCSSIRDIGHELKARGFSTYSLPGILAAITSVEFVAFLAIATRVMRNILRIKKDVHNFTDPVNAFLAEGLDNQLEVVGKGALYKHGTVNETPSNTYTIEKYGRTFRMLWEDWLKDDIGLFDSIKTRMFNAALRTEERVLSALFFDSTGPGNWFANTPSVLTLSVANLKTAVQQFLEAAVDGNGEPVAVEPAYLMVGPANKIAAMEILNSLNLDYTVDTSGSGTGVPIANPAGNALKDLNIKLLVNPYIPVLAPNKKSTWALFADPAVLPAGELGLLQDHNSPEVWMKQNHATRVLPGGGGLTPFDGDFEDDGIAFRVRYCFGGCTLDSRAGWASTGAGS